MGIERKQATVWQTLAVFGILFAFVGLVIGGVWWAGSALLGSDSTPPPSEPTTAPVASTTTTMSTDPVGSVPVLPISPQELKDSLASLNVELHFAQSDGWITAAAPHSDVTIDMFTQGNTLEAVEFWFRSSPYDSDIATVCVLTLFSLLSPGGWQEVSDWFNASLGVLDLSGNRIEEANRGGLYLYMQYVPDLSKVFLSMEPQV